MHVLGTVREIVDNVNPDGGEIKYRVSFETEAPLNIIHFNVAAIHPRFNELKSSQGKPSKIALTQGMFNGRPFWKFENYPVQQLKTATNS